MKPLAILAQTLQEFVRIGKIRRPEAPFAVALMKRFG
jgi:hypothetical protein